jgi:hypothetical protein
MVPVRDAVQRLLAGLYSVPDEPFLLAKIYLLLFFIVDQPGGSGREQAPGRWGETT